MFPAFKANAKRLGENVTRGGEGVVGVGVEAGEGGEGDHVK